jgi:membrane-bound lytic murein transglycosylase D
MNFEDFAPAEAAISSVPALTIESIEELAKSTPSTQPLRAPLLSQLDGLQVNPFLMGVVGKENSPQPETPANVPVFDRDRILTDADNRIDKQFEVTPTLKDRVGFWFDIYSKYDQNHRLIHNQRFPWIIYKIVDVTSIINATSPRVRWLRNVKADNFVKLETARVRKTIQKLANGTAPSRLSSDELPVFEALRKLGKDVRKNARLSLGEIHVQTGQRNFFITGLEVSPRYLSAMEKIFRAKKLPIELTRLPFVESSFNQEAVSKVGAGGIWQFMGDTGRKFLIVDGSIDERRSPFKASEAAAMLLKENHMILGHSWPLAITAWNHGPGGVRKACAAAHSKDLGTVVSRYHSKSFDFASSNFYSEFLGALYAERYNDVIFGTIAHDTELEPQVVRVQRSVKVNDVIRSSGLSNEEFLLMNPDLVQAQSSNSRLPVGFRIHLPEHARLSVEQLVGVHRGSRIARAN